MFQNPTVNLSKLPNSCVKIACFSSELILMFLYTLSCTQNASQQLLWFVHLSFVTFAVHPEERCIRDFGAEI